MAILILVVDFETFNSGGKIPQKYQINKKKGYFYIYHAPGNANLRGNERGTNVLLKVLADMQKDGFKIDLITTNGYVPYKNISYFQKQADLAIDHLYYGWYGNMLRECMAQGIPSATFIDPLRLKKHKLLYGTTPPIIDVTEETLRDVIEYYYNNRHKLYEIGLQQKDYINKMHNTDDVINRLIDLYNGKSNYLDPLPKEQY